MQGKVVSTKMNKTVVVEVERWVIHPVYKKRMKRNRRFSAHNEMEIKMGDFVEISEIKPISKTVNFAVTRVIGDVKEVAKK